jgi:hypothetical protein
MLTWIWSKQATASDPGATVPVITDTAVKGVLALAAYRDAAPVSAADVQLAEETTRQADHTTPEATITGSGAWVASLWADKTATTTTWATPDGQVQRQLLVDTGSGHPSMLVTDTGASVPAGSWPGVTATADSTSSNATMGTVVLRPAG